MKFKKEHKQKVQKAWEKFLQVSSFESIFFTEDQPEEFKTLCSLVYSLPSLKNNIDKDEILSYISYWLHNEKKNPAEGKHTDPIPSFISEEKIISGAKSFIKMLEGIPYECKNFFPIYSPIPEEIEFLKISETISILSREKLEEKYSFENVNPLLALALSHTYDAQNYICITTNGYPGLFGNGRSIADSVQKLREFLFFMNLVGHGEIQNYRQPSVWPNCFFISGMTGNERQSLTITQSTIYGLANFKFRENFWEPAKILREDKVGLGLALSILSGKAPEKGHERYVEAIETGVETKVGWMKKFWSLDHNKTSQISRAIEWGFMGETNHDLDTGFIQTCIGLEAILGDTTNIKIERLYDRAAYMLGESQEDRKNIIKQFQDIYELRSQVVHGKTAITSKKDRNLIYSAKRLLNKIILHEINMALKKAT
jgi:hypothetical protein